MSATLDRIGKMLAKADNTDNEAESEAYMDKAIALAAASNIDLAVARAHQADKTKREEPEERTVTVNPFERTRNRDHFMNLFSTIARANDCKIMIGYKSFKGFIFGFPSDIDVVEALFATLSVHMESEASTALKRGDNKTTMEWPEGSGQMQTFSYVDGRIWRQNFYTGFINNIEARLWAAKREAEARAGVVPDDVSSSVALVLKDKRDEVKDFYKSKGAWRAKGTWSGPKTTEYVYQGREAGHRAGERANLGTDDRSMSGASRKFLE